MRDNLRRSRALRDAFTQYDPRPPTGTVARHLTTLAALLRGLVARQSPQLPPMASHVPDGTTPESRVKRFDRWLGNDQVTDEGYVVPYATILLRPVAWQTWVLGRDGSGVGRGWVALMVPVVSQGRALPRAWHVRPGATGHCPADLPLALVEQVQEGIPPGASGVLRGDGACDGMRLQHTGQQAGWASVCRTGRHRRAVWPGASLRLAPWGCLSRPGPRVAWPDALLTEEAYGPVMRICGWATGHQEPRSLVRTMASAEEAGRLEGKRLRIEIV
jgi:hypothetical protein